ncbi:MAG: hypothetical protein EB038_02680 [Cyclobacteriaceae bacterium]|nr:hypothetical protein [Cyclobacteriaceae bacterium]
MLQATAQDLEKMNKNELRDYSLMLLGKIDSLQTEIASLQVQREQLNQALADAEQKNKLNLSEIQKLTNLAAKTQKELERVQAEKDAVILTLKKDVLQLQDSLATLQTTLLTAAAGTPSDPNDFLNAYFRQPFPLENNSFSLVLSKVIFGASNTNSSDYYEAEEEVMSLPEILPAEAFTYWGIKPKVKIMDGTKFNDFVLVQTLAYYNARLPKIQIYKNKLLTIVNKEGNEESFLMTINPLDGDNANNQRNAFQFNLVSEESNANQDYERSKNLTWRFFALDNEVYLALSYDQLKRINTELKDVDEGIEAFSEYYDRLVMATSFDSDYRQTTTGNGVYLSRKKDPFMKEALYVEPDQLIYLFKFK